jgi:hypothetical protein
MVPVLSTHKTSTRASVSIEFMSWTRVFFWASRTTDTARATLVSRYSPSGIMPMREATTAGTASKKVVSRTKISLQNRAMPMGIRAYPMTRMSLSSDCIIWDLPTPWSALAFAASRAA